MQPVHRVPGLSVARAIMARTVRPWWTEGMAATSLADACNPPSVSVAEVAESTRIAIRSMGGMSPSSEAIQGGAVGRKKWTTRATPKRRHAAATYRENGPPFRQRKIATI